LGKLRRLRRFKEEKKSSTKLFILLRRVDKKQAVKNESKGTRKTDKLHIEKNSSQIKA
jgi:hypothetical protein